MMRADHVVIGLGGMGSAATAALAARGRVVIGLEQFAFGHDRGASHDTSRILRHSYHTPTYVRLTQEAYDDWERLGTDTDRNDLVLKVGGIDLFPHGCVIPVEDYSRSLTEVGIDYELLDRSEAVRRWPMFDLPDDIVALYQDRGSIVHAARTVATLQDRARALGATLRDHTPVRSVEASGEHYRVVTDDEVIETGSVVVAADAWTNQVIAGLGVEIPLVTTLEQVTYFEPADPAPFQPDRMPLWIWMDDPSFYGFPCFGEATIKAAQDCGGPEVDPDERTFDPDPHMRGLLAEFVQGMLPGCGPAVRSKRCQYTLTPDRDFVLDHLPGHPGVVVGLGAGHGFKFVPTLGRILAELATTGRTFSDISDFRLDRPGLAPDAQRHWLV